MFHFQFGLADVMSSSQRLNKINFTDVRGYTHYFWVILYVLLIMGFTLWLNSKPLEIPLILDPKWVTSITDSIDSITDGSDTVNLLAEIARSIAEENFSEDIASSIVDQIGRTGLIDRFPQPGLEFDDTPFFIEYVFYNMNHRFIQPKNKTSQDSLVEDNSLMLSHNSKAAFFGGWIIVTMVALAQYVYMA